MENVGDMLVMFSFYSFLGWVLETSYASAKAKRLVNRGFLKGCFCPIYGFSAVTILILHTWIRSRAGDGAPALLLTVVGSSLLVTALEYITGYVMDRAFHRRWWDYRDQAANLHGYVCVSYSLLWGLLALVVVLVLHPPVQEAINRIPDSAQEPMAVLLALYFLIDFSKSVADALHIKGWLRDKIQHRF